MTGSYYICVTRQSSFFLFQKTDRVSDINLMLSNKLDSKAPLDLQWMNVRPTKWCSPMDLPYLSRSHTFILIAAAR